MKIRCNKVKQLIVHFVAGEITGRLAATVGNHINVCESCRREYENTRCTLRLAQQAPYISPADGMKAFILALLEKGITQDEIDLMAKKNPARLLGLTA